ncbi:hypothetical protein TIFTF001_033524, partial [Ficus carica]
MSHLNSYICYLKGLNLTGTLPEEFGNLAHLQELSLFGNRLNGSIPEEIGEISTLAELVLEQNQLQGPLPESLGGLSNLQRLAISSNNFTGTIPETFGNLKNLTEFRVDGSGITGSIPSFIGSLTKLERLDMQGTSMEGPIPNISGLLNLTELRISDLSGPIISFPDGLTKLTNLGRLILRNCSISGQIPVDIGNMSALTTLDLSFNRLSGEIPWKNDQYLRNIDFLYLTNNSLTGEVPNWMMESNNDKHFDLSYNNFNGTPPDSCTEMQNVNLVSGYSSHKDSSSTSTSTYWCFMKDLPCPELQPKYITSIPPVVHSLYINCGGPPVGEYEADQSAGGKSYFRSSRTVNWAYSSTGDYMDNNRINNYTVQTAFSSNESYPEIFQTARIAPLSLKYYGLCL